MTPLIDQLNAIGDLNGTFSPAVLRGRGITQEAISLAMSYNILQSNPVTQMLTTQPRHLRGGKLKEALEDLRAGQKVAVIDKEDNTLKQRQVVSQEGGGSADVVVVDPENPEETERVDADSVAAEKEMTEGFTQHDPDWREGFEDLAKNCMAQVMSNGEAVARLLHFKEVGGTTGDYFDVVFKACPEPEFTKKFPDPAGYSTKSYSTPLGVVAAQLRDADDLTPYLNPSFSESIIIEGRSSDALWDALCKMHDTWCKQADAEIKDLYAAKQFEKARTRTQELKAEEVKLRHDLENWMKKWEDRDKPQPPPIPQWNPKSPTRGLSDKEFKLGPIPKEGVRVQGMFSTKFLNRDEMPKSMQGTVGVVLKFPDPYSAIHSVAFLTPRGLDLLWKPSDIQPRMLHCRLQTRDLPALKDHFMAMGASQDDMNKFDEQGRAMFHMTVGGPKRKLIKPPKDDNQLKMGFIEAINRLLKK